MLHEIDFFVRCFCRIYDKYLEKKLLDKEN